MYLPFRSFKGVWDVLYSILGNGDDIKAENTGSIFGMLAQKAACGLNQAALLLLCYGKLCLCSGGAFTAFDLGKHEQMILLQNQIDFSV